MNPVTAVAFTYGDAWAAVISLVFGVIAIGLGGPITLWVFRRVDASEKRVPAQTVTAAAHVLRGGAWIGILERTAMYLSILAGWPEGVALAIAIKGLGRYQELRTATPGAAERFIIGTFTSTLFACGCALAAQFLGALVR